MAQGGGAGQPHSSSETIERILASARAEFGTKGLDGARMEDIARAAGISKQLIYHYFRGKDDLYSEMLDGIAQRNNKKLSEPDYESLPPLGAARAFFEILFDIYEHDPFTTMVTVDQGLHAGAQVRHTRRIDQLRQILLERLANVVARGHASGEIALEIDASTLHFLAVVTVTGSLGLRPMFVRYTGAEQHKSLTGDRCWRETISNFFMRGLTAEKSGRHLDLGEQR